MAAATIRQYLEGYAEPIVGWFQTEFLAQLPRAYQFVLVIPVFDEPLDCLEQVLPLDLQQTLVIVVVNSAVDSDPVAVAQTQAFWKQFSPTEHAISCVPLGQESDCLIVDCATDGRQLPVKQGVGLARKIGGDLALACIHRGVVACPWIHCTDADVKLPLHYFDNTLPAPDVAVAIYPFQHVPPHENILFYEISLRYYVIQLAQVGSPYAFQTIGSLLKINAYHYAMVRGFPKRTAAEDFYMLNKLAKTGQILRLKVPVIQLASRISKRVPFGTGAAMARLAQQPKFELYHPQIFQYLKIWLDVIPKLWTPSSNLPTTHLSVRERFQSQISLQTDIKQADIKQAATHNTLVLDALLALGLEKVLPQADRQCRDLAHFCRYLWVWFDAFRTLKFIHYLRDHAFPNLPLSDAVGMMDIMSLHPPETTPNPSFSTAHLTQINTQLILLENQLPKAVGPTLGSK
ncbi:MAG: hypothetical protein AAF921_12860 [Cyanobacteria bacterium P01_D01_bin.44]